MTASIWPYRKLFAVLLCLGLCAPALADEALVEGKRRLDAGDASGAWALLEPLESRRAGEPAFDFLLGLAALESGKTSRAVFALERVLALEPDNARARAEIARAYLLLGENRAAREEFDRVRKEDLPQGVAATIDSLLAMIQRADARDKPSLRSYIEISGGIDSNVNASTEATSVAVPALGLATLNPNSVQTGDAFGSIAGGVAYRYPIGAGRFLTGDLNAVIRQNKNDSQFDTTTVEGALGWQQARGPETVTVALTGSNFQRDGADLRNAVGLNAQWQRDYQTVRQASLFLQYFDLRYPDQSIRDADRAVLGAGYAQAVAARSVVFGSFYGGAELEKADNVPQLGHRLGGLRVGLQHRFDDRWTLLFNLGYEARRYGGVEPLFAEKRRDSQFDAGLALAWQFADRWRAVARAGYVKNDSDIPVFEYSREVYSLGLRCEL